MSSQQVPEHHRRVIRALQSGPRAPDRLHRRIEAMEADAARLSPRMPSLRRRAAPRPWLRPAVAAAGVVGALVVVLVVALSVDGPGESRVVQAAELSLSPSTEPDAPHRRAAACAAPAFVCRGHLPRLVRGVRLARRWGAQRRARRPGDSHRLLQAHPSPHRLHGHLGKDDRASRGRRDVQCRRARAPPLQARVPRRRHVRAQRPHLRALRGRARSGHAGEAGLLERRRLRPLLTGINAGRVRLCGERPPTTRPR